MRGYPDALAPRCLWQRCLSKRTLHRYPSPQNRFSGQLAMLAMVSSILLAPKGNALPATPNSVGSDTTSAVATHPPATEPTSAGDPTAAPSATAAASSPTLSSTVDESVAVKLSPKDADESSVPDEVLREIDAGPEELNDSANDGAPPLERISVLPCQAELADEENVVQWRAPTTADIEARRICRQVSFVLREALQDLGFTLVVADTGRTNHNSLDEQLLAVAETRWAIVPRIELIGEEVRIELLAAIPKSRVLLKRVELADLEHLDVRTVVMIRDITRVAWPVQATPQVGETVQTPAVVYHARSPGRSVLVLGSALLGGYAGFTLQRAGDSNDGRLIYPMIALGTGIGVGASMVIAEEWDVGLGDAWFLAATTLWPTSSAVLLSEHHGASNRERLMYGLAGAFGGAALGTGALGFGGMSTGGALVTHSGGAYGTLLGGMAERMIAGGNDLPRRGLAYGGMAGVVLAGAWAAQFRSPSPSRILFIDMSAGLGALAGAALASPLVFDDSGEDKQRLFFGSVTTGLLAGGLIGAWMTPSEKSPSDSSLQMTPFFDSTIESTHTRYTLGLRGSF
ncbi:MAG: hypothetical protein HRU17_03590 [Polyangiaceae bacterium]|nr:hypothetical protein [Polyangiaceae bacterium]